MTLNQGLKSLVVDSTLTAIHGWWPGYEEMDESALNAILEKLRAVSGVMTCPYSKVTIVPADNPAMIMVDADGSVKLGVERIMKVRSLMLRAPYAELHSVLKTVRERHEELVAARELRERMEAQRRQRVAGVKQIAESIQLILNKDGGFMSTEVFNAELIRVATEMGQREDHVRLFFEIEGVPWPQPLPAAEPAPVVALITETSLSDDDVHKMVGAHAVAVCETYYSEGTKPATGAAFDIALKQRVLEDPKGGEAIYQRYEDLVLLDTVKPFIFVPALQDEPVDLTRHVVDRAAVELTMVGTVAGPAQHPADGSTA